MCRNEAYMVNLEEIGKKAVTAKYSLQGKNTEEKNAALFLIADRLTEIRKLF